jgi:hypothetical protein
MNQITLKTFYPQTCIDIKFIDIDSLKNEYNYIKNRIDSGYILRYDTLLLEALNTEILRRQHHVS